MPPGIEIQTALAAAQGQTRQHIFYNLFKARELDHTPIHSPVKRQSPLYGPSAELNWMR